MRLKAHVDTQASPRRISKADLSVDEARKMLNPVQNCLNFQLHGWSLGSCCSVAAEHHWITRRPVFFYPHRAILRDGSENRALQECNPSAEPSMDCKDCIPPGSGKLPGRALALRMPLQAMVKAKNSSFPLGPQAAILNFLPTNSATDPEKHTIIKWDLPGVSQGQFMK